MSQHAKTHGQSSKVLLIHAMVVQGSALMKCGPYYFGPGQQILSHTTQQVMGVSTNESKFGFLLMERKLGRRQKSYFPSLSSQMSGTVSLGRLLQFLLIYLIFQSRRSELACERERERERDNSNYDSKNSTADIGKKRFYSDINYFWRM